MQPEQILELMRPLVIVCDRAGILITEAGGFGWSAHWPREQFVGRHVLDLVHEDDREALISVFIQAQGREDFTVAQPIPFTVRIAAPDGSVVAVDAVATGPPDGDDAGWVVVLTPHDQQTTPVAALTSLLDGEPLDTTLELAVDHIAGSGSDGRRLCAVLLTFGIGSEGSRMFGTTMPDHLAHEVQRHRADLLRGHRATTSVRLGPAELPPRLADAVELGQYEELILAHIPVGGVGAATLVVANGPARYPLPGNVRQFIDRVVGVVELALRADRERRALLHASRHDPLTGLANRRRLEEFVAERSDRNLTVIYTDLDRFKEVNDRHSHSVGDEVLRTIADRIAASCRPGDLACRIGGDEFVVVVDDIDAAEAERMVERLEHSIARPLPTHIGVEFITASVGFAISAHDGTTRKFDIIADADDAMRRAKDNRRRR